MPDPITREEKGRWFDELLKVQEKISFEVCDEQVGKTFRVLVEEPSRKEGYVYAEAQEMVNHHRLPFIEVCLKDEAGELVAIMTSSGYRKDKKLF